MVLRLTLSQEGKQKTGPVKRVCGYGNALLSYFPPLSTFCEYTRKPSKTLGFYVIICLKDNKVNTISA
jgi:hypothetical protein